MQSVNNTDAQLTLKTPSEGPEPGHLLLESTGPLQPREPGAHASQWLARIPQSQAVAPVTSGNLSWKTTLGISLTCSPSTLRVACWEHGPGAAACAAARGPCSPTVRQVCRHSFSEAKLFLLPRQPPYWKVSQAMEEPL